MNITVILCTYNRCDLLAKALETIAVQTVPDSVSWEVLVVDNNSSDRTKDVVDSFALRYPARFRYVFEPRQGKSHALNKAIREARGEILAFTDDDITAEATWLENLTAPLCSGQAVGTGGRVLVQWDCAIPEWIPTKEKYALGPLALFDLGRDPGPLDRPPVGANMAFRREVFERHPGFRTDLGPRPGNEIRSEDTEFGRRVIQGGELLLYQPSAIVYHPIAPNRLRQSYFLAWWFDKGRADLREFGFAEGTKWTVKNVPLYLFRRFIYRTVRWMFAVSPAQRFSHKFKVWWLCGEIAESYRASAQESDALTSRAQASIEKNL